MLTYPEAQANNEFKQIYLDKIMHSCPESVQELVYDPDWKLREAHEDKLIAEGHLEKSELENARLCSKGAYFLVVFSPSLLGLGRKHPIFVSDNGFNKMKSESHFLSSVLDHEALHTNDLMHGMKLPNNILIDHSNIGELSPQTVINAREAIAYRNQLRNLKNRGVDDEYFKEWLEWQLDCCRQSLYSINPKSDLEKRVLENSFY